MSAVRAWLERRAPRPPDDLLPWLDGVGDGGPLHELLTEHALASLAKARATPGPVRRSAFHLLAADALLTYACEAALESTAPVETLSQILRRTAAPGP